MALFNYATKEITLKVVYYGPGMSGKTTNLQVLYSALDPSILGKFISTPTEADRTLFFDFLPVNLGKIRDFTVKFQLYTIPGQVQYNATRKLVLKGTDAIVFVVDSQKEMKEQNIESFENMKENLKVNNINPDNIPIILQYNKRDLPNIFSIEDLNNDLNKKGHICVEAVAFEGKGVYETIEIVVKALLEDVSKKYNVEIVASTPFSISSLIRPGMETEQFKALPPSLPVDKALKEGAGIKMATIVQTRELPQPVEAQPLPQQEVWLGEEEVTPFIQPQALSPVSEDTYPVPEAGSAPAESSSKEITEALAKITEALSLLSAEVNGMKKEQAEAATKLAEIHAFVSKIKEKGLLVQPL